MWGRTASACSVCVASACCSRALWVDLLFTPPCLLTGSVALREMNAFARPFWLPSWEMNASGVLTICTSHFQSILECFQALAMHDRHLDVAIGAVELLLHFFRRGLQGHAIDLSIRIPALLQEVVGRVTVLAALLQDIVVGVLAVLQLQLGEEVLHEIQLCLSPSCFCRFAEQSAWP